MSHSPSYKPRVNDARKDGGATVFRISISYIWAVHIRMVLLLVGASTILVSFIPQTDVHLHTCKLICHLRVQSALSKTLTYLRAAVYNLFVYGFLFNSVSLLFF